MSVFRTLLESLLLFALLVTRMALVAAGLAAVSSSVIAAGMVHAPGDPLGMIRWLGVDLGVGGVLLFVTLTWIHIPRTPDADTPSTRPSWLGLVAIALTGQAVTAAIYSVPLVHLWSESIAFLNQSGLFEGFDASGSMSGLVFFPIFAVLFVPALEVAAAFWLVAGPLLLVGLFLTRSRIFPRGLVMTGIAQAALVVGCQLAALVFGMILPPVLVEILKTPGPESRPAAAALLHVQDVIVPTANAYAWMLVASLVWVPAMMFSKRMATTFTRGRGAT